MSSLDHYRKSEDHLASAAIRSRFLICVKMHPFGLSMLIYEIFGSGTSWMHSQWDCSCR